MCDNTDCTNYVKKVYLTVLTEEFDHDVCWWCPDCLERDEDMVYMSYWEIEKLHKRLMKL